MLEGTVWIPKRNVFYPNVDVEWEYHYLIISHVFEGDRVLVRRVTPRLSGEHSKYVAMSKTDFQRSYVDVFKVKEDLEFWSMNYTYNP